MKITFTDAVFLFIAMLPVKFLWRYSAIRLSASEDSNAQSLGAAMLFYEG